MGPPSSECTGPAEPQAQRMVDSGAETLAIGDVNGDGVADTVIGFGENREGNVVVRINAPDGRVRRRPTIAFWGRFAMSAFRISMEMVSLICRSSPTLPMQFPFAWGIAGGASGLIGGSILVTRSSGQHSMGTLNTDGRSDMVVTLSGGAGFSYHQGFGDGSFSQGAVIQALLGLGSVALGDVTGDGHLDVVGVSTTLGRLSITRGTGNGLGATNTLQPVGVSMKSTSPILIDNDLDILAVGRDDFSHFVAYNDGVGRFPVTTQLSVFDGRDSIARTHAAIADLNNDGYLDIAISNQSENVIYEFIANRLGSFGQVAIQPPLGLNPRPALSATDVRALVSLDIDSDADADLMTVNGVTITLRSFVTMSGESLGHTNG